MDKAIRDHSESDASSESSDSPVVVPLKIKYRNRVKKIAQLPEKFKRLDKVVSKKYEEFSEGKPSYTMWYLDDENELIGISDDEDYDMFKSHVKESNLPIAKVFLTRKGEEANFNPAVDDAQTVCESVIMEDVDISKLNDMKSVFESTGMKMPNDVSRLMMENIQNKLDMLLAEKTKKDTKKGKKPSKKGGKGKKGKGGKKGKQEKPKVNVEKEKEEEVKLDQSSDNDPKATDLPLSNPFKKVIKKEEPVAPEVPKEEVQNVDLKEEAIIIEAPKEVESKEPVDEAPEEVKMPSEPEAKHEFAIKAIKKVEDSPGVIHEPEVEDAICQQCGANMEGQTRYISSIETDYQICELCEVRSTHPYVFIKVRQGVEFDPKVYDNFWQKILSKYAPVFFEESDVQEAIINVAKSDTDRRVKGIDAKKASILDKNKYKEGILVTKGQEVEISWKVKNFTNRAWSEDVIVMCLQTSDILLNEQKTTTCLDKGEKGQISIKFMAPRAAFGKDVLDANFLLFDRVENKAFGEEFKVKLIPVDK